MEKVDKNFPVINMEPGQLEARHSFVIYRRTGGWGNLQHCGAQPEPGKYIPFTLGGAKLVLRMK